MAILHDSAFNDANVVGKVYAAAFLVEYRHKVVLAARMNQRYRSLLKPGGDTIVINKPGGATVSDYTWNGGDISYRAADIGTPITIQLDKTKYWAVTMDDLNQQAVKMPVLQQAVSQAAEKMAQQVDSDVRTAFYAHAAAAPVTGAALPMDSGVANAATTSKFTQLGLERIHLYMDLQGIPRSGRWMVIGPYTAAAVQYLAMVNDELLARNDSKINGSFGSFGGFSFYVDTEAPVTVANDANPDKTATETFLAGTNEEFAFLDTIRKQERMRSQGRFADLIRGLYQYGYGPVQRDKISGGLSTGIVKGTYVCKSSTAFPTA